MADCPATIKNLINVLTGWEKILEVLYILEAIDRFDKEKSQECTNQKVDPEEWDVDILEANAYYNSTNNSMNIMLGILGVSIIGRI